MHRNTSVLAAVCLMVLLALTSAGCSRGKPLGLVAGTVTFQGRLVTEGQVNFFCAKNGTGASPTLTASGTYSIPEGLNVGRYTVCITPPAPTVAGGAPAAKSPSDFTIPEKYRNPDASGISVDVQAGNNEFAIELQP